MGKPTHVPPAKGAHAIKICFNSLCSLAIFQVVTVAVTPQYQAVQVKPTYSSGYGTNTARSVSNVVAAKPASNYGYVSNATQQPAYSTPQPTPTTYSNNASSTATTQSNTPSGAYGKSHNQSECQPNIKVRCSYHNYSF